jgi:hypothetical protein
LYLLLHWYHWFLPHRKFLMFLPHRWFPSYRYSRKIHCCPTIHCCRMFLIHQTFPKIQMSLLRRKFH